jgi:hypothetical protein
MPRHRSDASVSGGSLVSSRTQGKLQNVAESVRQRLYQRAKATGEDFQLILIRYGCERLLYRRLIPRYCSAGEGVPHAADTRRRQR